MSNEIIQLAQSDASALENLEVTDQKMIDLNSQLAGLLGEYQRLNFSRSDQSFFNFQNIYFWLLLIGLFLLALGLVLLLSELKKSSRYSREEKVTRILAKKIEEPKKIEISQQEFRPENVLAENKQKTKRKSIKIKVVKVK